MAEEVKKSREIEERLSAESEKVKGVIQSGGHQIVGSSPQEVEHGALGLTLELDQCQREALDWIGSRLELMAEEVKMSWEMKERFSAEKVKGTTQTGGHQIVGSSPQEIENVAALLKHCPSPQNQQLKAPKEEQGSLKVPKMDFFIKLIFEVVVFYKYAKLSFL